MKMNTNVVIMGFLGLILGSVIGYYFGTTRMTPQSTTNMHGAMSDMTLSLEGKTGEALEQAFLDGMIIHHEGAVLMAHMLLAGTARPELVKIGNDIVTAQTGEIEMMKEWRMVWFAK